MARYKYKAVDHAGEAISGEVEAATRAIAYSVVQGRGFDIFKLEEVKTATPLFKRRTVVKHKDMARYIRQLATLIRAGVSLLDALKSLARSDAHPHLAEASEKVRKDLRSGLRLSTAMENHLSSLPPYVPRLAELGEATGQTAKALTDASERMEYEDSMRQEIRTALSYPMFLSVIGSGIVLLMFLFVVPRFGTLLGSNTENLPTLSRWVIGAGLGLKANTIPIFSGIILVIISVRFLFKRLNLGNKARNIIEHMPVLGPVLVRSDLGSWCRTVGVALDNGANLLSALQLGEYGLRSQRLRRAFATTRAEIRAGKNIDEVLSLSVPDFDPLTIDLIRTGRTSGELAKMLLFVGATEEEETRELTKRLSSLAEPIAILVVSLIVGTIVISIVMAMTSLYEFDI